MNPLVSVIVPNYNHERYLVQRIESVLNQSYQNFELILLDDCSTDSSRDVLGRYHNHSKVSNLVLNKENSGSPFRQWKTGVELAKGSLVWIAESDDYADKDFLKTLVANFQSRAVSLAYCDSVLINTVSNTTEVYSNRKNRLFNTQKWGNDYKEDGTKEILNYLLFRNTINNMSAALFRKRVFDDLNWDFLMRLRNVGDQYLYHVALLTGQVAYSSKQLNFIRKDGYNLTIKNSITTKVQREFILVNESTISRDEFKSYHQVIRKSCLYWISKSFFQFLAAEELTWFEWKISDLRKKRFIGSTDVAIAKILLRFGFIKRNAMQLLVEILLRRLGWSVIN